jgi:hypothetical protein
MIFLLQSNIDGSARLEWVNWKQFSKLPQGAVSVKQDLFVAREEGFKGKKCYQIIKEIFICTFDFQEAV